MKERDIVLLPIAQADGQKKNRPVLLLREMPKYGDFLVCGISSQLHQLVDNFDELVHLNDTDFPGSGLVKPSLIRLSFLAIVRRAEVMGRLGIISPDRHQRLLSNLADYLRS
jgi:mRNA interferase MazF